MPSAAFNPFAAMDMNADEWSNTEMTVYVVKWLCISVGLVVIGWRLEKARRRIEVARGVQISSAQAVKRSSIRLLVLIAINLVVLASGIIWFLRAP